MTLSLQLFGAPALHEEGGAISLSRRKAMALLSYLAVTRSRHHRETLAALLWPESDATAAYSALRNVLWILRQTSLSDALCSDRSTVALMDSEHLDVDVNRFRELTSHCPAQSHSATEVCVMCEPRLKEAVSLWVGPFMHGFAVSNSFQFDDWQFAEGEALRRELTETLDRMITHYAAAQDWASAARYARQWLHVDALNELSYRKLMVALAHQGKRSEALQTFGDCMSILKSELGLSPEAATVELAESIRTSDISESASTKPRSHHLPPVLNPMIGRREAAAQLEGLLAAAEPGQIVTLVGLGGAGKTSLALHVGRRIEDKFADGAIFVPLDSEGSDSMAASTMAQSLGIEHPRDDRSALIEQLSDHLKDRKVLLILDGAERVLPQVIAVLPALCTSPHVQILLTSRIALNTGNEIVMPLHGLAYPPLGIPTEKAADYAAIRLLRLSAQRQGHWAGDIDAELGGMSRIARLLEGSPLGLEMAAGWRAVLTWEEIADRVSDKLEFLVHMREDVAPKHRGFAAVFEQAWSMLGDEAKAALRKLSIFRGDFTIAAAEHVAEVVPSVLALLVNRCLVKRVGPKRYELHELLRQFASGKLTSAGREVDRIRGRHAEHYLQAVAGWFQELTGPGQYSALRRMREDLANVRFAFQHAASHGATDLLCESSEGLFFYYDMCTQFEEAEAVFLHASKAYSECDDQDGDVGAFLQVAAGWFAYHIWPDRATERLEAGMELLGNKTPETRLHAMATVICAYASSEQQIESHAKRMEQSVYFYRAHNDLWGEGLATAAWASIERSRGNVGKAESLAYDSLRLHREAGDAWGEGLVLSSLARMSEARGDLNLALARYEESQRLSEPIAADIVGVIEAISGQARVAGKLGDAKKSEKLAMQAVHLSAGMGNRLQMARARVELARARRLLADPASAVVLLEEAFALLAHRQWSHWQANCAVELLELALDASEIGAAERWLREASMLEPEHPALLPLSQQVNTLRKNGGEVHT